MFVALAAGLGGAAGCSDGGASGNTPNYPAPAPQDSGESAGRSPPGKAAPALTGGSTGGRMPAAPPAKKQ